MAFEPQINRVFVLLYLHMPPFVQQGNHCFVFDRLSHGIVRFNKTSKSGKTILLSFEQWRTREADVTGIGQHLPHARCERTEVCAVAFIYEDDNIR